MTNSPGWSNPSKRQTVWMGFDPREATAFAVARHSLEKRTTAPIGVRGLVLDILIAQRLYTRPTSRKDGRLWDELSQAPMSTEFACSRFLVPQLAQSGWAAFMDCDVLVRTDITRLFAQADSRFAVMVVKHRFDPPEGVKMDGQAQLRYARKNWSSVCLWNCDHKANKELTPDLVNTLPGRDLHRFAWLADEEIGALDPGWNFLVGHSDPAIDPAIVHFTEGGPWMAGYEDVAYADEWRAELVKWAI